MDTHFSDTIECVYFGFEENMDFSRLGHDVSNLILSLLNIRDIIRLSRTCTGLRNLVKHTNKIPDLGLVPDLEETDAKVSTYRCGNKWICYVLQKDKYNNIKYVIQPGYVYLFASKVDISWSSLMASFESGILSRSERDNLYSVSHRYDKHKEDYIASLGRVLSVHTQYEDSVYYMYIQDSGWAEIYLSDILVYIWYQDKLYLVHVHGGGGVRLVESYYCVSTGDLLDFRWDNTTWFQNYLDDMISNYNSRYQIQQDRIAMLV